MSVFTPTQKKGNAKESSNYCTIALISHASKGMLKILKVRLQHYVNRELPDVKADLEKAEEVDIKFPTFTGSKKKQEDSRRTSTSATLTTLKLSTMWITTNWKTLKEMGIPDHITCLLRYMYTGQKATV